MHSFGAAWVYAFAGAPARTQAVVQRVENELFTAGPGGLPGNDDLGATSAWCGLTSREINRPSAGRARAIQMAL